MVCLRIVEYLISRIDLSTTFETSDLEYLPNTSNLIWINSIAQQIVHWLEIFTDAFLALVVILLVKCFYSYMSMLLLSDWLVFYASCILLPMISLCGAKKFRCQQACTPATSRLPEQPIRSRSTIHTVLPYVIWMIEHGLVGF